MSMTPDKMRDLSRTYYKKATKEPFASSWIVSSTLLLIGAEIIERLDKK